MLRVRRVRARSCAFGLAWALAWGASGCARDAAPAAPAAPPLFELVAPAQSGVTFENDLPDDTAFNQLVYLYYYNGGGVAVGDYDGDGLPDLYFTSNLGGGRLYHNLGHFRFEDVSARAGVQRGAGDWTTGATFADVNGDGKPDLYVSGVDYQGKHGKNVLYVNNGDGTFTDRTTEYGLGHVGYGTQALFFDYDGDGDLDAYLLNHSTHTEHGSSAGPERDVPHPRAGDKLLRNEGGHFVDVTQQAHVYSGVEGYGLGVVASDFDGTGCPDLFVTNDFQENDFLYRNSCRGQFRESIADAMPHTSRFSMGVDAADFNNDGRPDLMVLDMLPDREDVLRTSASADDYVLADMRIRAGYHPQFERNTLELNRGGGKFSDIGFAAGVAATDWSWSPLFADLDNDGWKDLFISDGIFRRPNDLDYIQYVGNPAVQASLAAGITRENLSVVRQMPSVPKAPHAFRNDGGLTFSDVSAAWGFVQPGFGNGAAYVDLDNDGALDLVVNRVNAPAAIYRNRARSMNGRHFLTVTLRGEGKNTGGIGARVTAWTGRMQQLLEEEPTRGFESSVDPRLHFGLGAATRVDSLVVIWPPPDRRMQRLTNVAADQFLTLSQRDAKERWTPPKPPATTTFVDVTASTAPHVKHEEDSYSDFDREPLIPHLLSTEGPALAVGDVNGDGLDDIYVGGAKWQPGRLLIQQRDGTFRLDTEPDFVADKISEDVDAAFFDANGDGHPDLLVVSGGNEFTGNAEQLLPRLYLNDGHGHFHRDRAAIPAIYDNGACVAVGDYDGDGHPDLFIGSRVVGGKYGLGPRSHLLRNDGHGKFTEVTDQVAPALVTPGMVTSAAWVDYDGDGKLDLVVAGEWTPVRVLHNEGGRLVDRTAQVGLSGSEGWWSSVTVADVNGDGRPDLVLGNLGLNSYLRASAREPTRLYVGDLFGTGGTTALLTTYVHGTSWPIASRDELLKVAPQLRARFPTYKAYAAATIDSIVPREALARANVLEAHTFASAVAINRGGRFDLRPLPMEAQLAPIYAAAAGDFDGDGKSDLLVAGNLYGAPPLQGRYDAMRGLLLHGRGDGTFDPVELPQSGVDLEGETRRMRRVRLAGGAEAIVVARNNADLVILKLRAPAKARATVAARGEGKR